MNPAPASGKYNLLESLESRTLFSSLPPVFAPRNLTAVATSASSVKLKWVDQSVNEMGFAVERSTDQINFDVVIVTGPGAVSWTDTGLDPDTQYTYRMYAFTQTDFSDFSPTATTVTPPTSFADRDSQGTLFIHANTGVDIVTVIDNFASIDVNVNGAIGSFSKFSEPITAYTLITANNDHTINVNLNGAPTLKGNAQSNDIVGLSGDDDVLHVKINGSATTFSRSLITRMNVFTYAGSDRISVLPAVGAVNVSAGDGADSIFTGTGDDSIDGGRGDDLIKASDGNDLVKGGAGNDIMYGQNGDDTMLGGDGDDKLVGGDGIDSIEGNDGKDRLYGGVGEDLLKGGNGKDSIFQDS